MPRHATREAIAQARELCNVPTEPECKLWRELRVLNKRGYHFRRQVPFRGYTLDFVEHSLSLVIELDGSQHGLEEQRKHDAIRDAVLASQGYTVLRFWNRELKEDIELVVGRILHELELRPPHPKTRSAF